MLALLVRASLEGAVLAACVWLLCRVLPRLSSRVRALLWWCVAAKFIVTLAWPAPIGVPVLPIATDTRGATAAITAAPPLSPPPAAGAERRPAAPPAPGSGAPEVPWTALLLGAWGLGVGIALLRTLHGWRRTRAVIARSLPADEGLHAVVRELSGRLARGRRLDLRVSAEVESPLIVGVLRPVILVPARGFAALTPDQQRMALCHEVAHLGRGDMWLGCVPAAAERCFFFHPLARLAAREYAFWREAACDEAVLAALGASPQSYGRMLLALGVSRHDAAFSAAGAASSFQNLKRRIIMLDHTSPSSRRARLLAACVVAAAALAIMPIKAVARSAAPDALAQSVAPAESAAPAQSAARAESAAPPSARIAQPVPALALAAPTESPPAPVEPAPAATAGIAKAQEARAQELRFVLFRENGHTSMSGSTRDVERARRHQRGGERLLWFRYGGQEYVVRDPGVLREVEELWEPVGRVGEEQGRIGAQQGALGEQQGRIGMQQGEIGAQQARLGARQAAIASSLARLASREAGAASASERREIQREREELQAESRRLGDDMGALGRRMGELGRPMSDLGSQMTELGREMTALGGQMRAAVERANSGMLTLARRAIGSGTAVAVG